MTWVRSAHDWGAKPCAACRWTTWPISHPVDRFIIVPATCDGPRLSQACLDTPATLGQHDNVTGEGCVPRLA